jgi:endonuclease/exonuclease/phosphatase family metal-dependent hydrolase
MAAVADILPEHAPAAAPPEFESLHVGSYNIHRCVGTDGRCDMQRVADVITEMGCDTIGLQEVDSSPGAHSDSHQLEYLAEATGMQAIAAATIIKHDRAYGNALLTRRKILDVRRHDLSFLRFEPRGALEVDLDVSGTCVRVFVMHLGLLPIERRYQMRKVLNGSAHRRARRHQRMAATQPAAALAAWRDGQASLTADVPRVCADVRARPGVGAAAWLAASIRGASLGPVALCVRPLSGEGGGCAGGRRAA